MRILFLTNVPSPYRVDFFNELGKFCELTVAFEKRTSDERDKSWSNYKFENFKGVFLKGISLNTDTAICFGVKKIIKEGKFNKIICANFTSPTGMIAIRYMRRHRISYWLESDGGFAKCGKGFKENVKKYFIKGAEGYFSTGKAHDEYYLTYGAEPKRIYRYPFTSLYERDILAELPTRAEKRVFREKLGFKEEKIVLAVGRFIPCKGFDLLIKAAAGLSKDIGFYFVGGVPTEEYLALREEYALENVHFVGFRDKEALKEYYQAADVFVLPTRGDIWGLVINEGMACGLPVISTDRCVAAMELVENGVNGYIIPVDNVQVLSESINKVLCDESKVLRMSQASLDKIHSYTFENMTKLHIEILKGI